MLDPNLNIWVLLLYAYILYGCGYALGLAGDTSEDNKPGPIAFCFALFCAVCAWPFIKGFNDGTE